MEVSGNCIRLFTDRTVCKSLLGRNSAKFNLNFWNKYKGNTTLV